MVLTGESPNNWIKAYRVATLYLGISTYSALGSKGCSEILVNRHLTMEARARSQASMRVIFVGQSGTGIGCGPSASFIPCQYHSTIPPYSFIRLTALLNTSLKLKTSRRFVSSQCMSTYPQRRTTVWQVRASASPCCPEHCALTDRLPHFLTLQYSFPLHVEQWSQQLNRDVPPLKSCNGGLTQIRGGKKVNGQLLFVWVQICSSHIFKCAYLKVPCYQNKGLTRRYVFSLSLSLCLSVANLKPAAVRNVRQPWAAYLPRTRGPIWHEECPSLAPDRLKDFR